MGCRYHRCSSQQPLPLGPPSSLVLHRHPRRDATLRSLVQRTEHALRTQVVGAQILLIADQYQISHSGANKVHSDKASCQPRLGEAPVFSSYSTVSGNSGLVWG